MSLTVESPFDALASGAPAEAEVLRTEISDLDFKLKAVIDAGLPVDTFPFYRGLKAASEAALAIIAAARP